MQNLTPHELISPVVVAAHDAGAANLIIGWLRDRCDLELRTCLGGPAIDLWTAAIGKPQILQAKNAIIGAKTLISGTSYISQIEHQVRNLAAVHKCPQYCSNRPLGELLWPFLAQWTVNSSE